MPQAHSARQPVPAYRPLTKEALRLLRALDASGASARPDPGRETHVLVVATGPTVSLGRGAHRMETLDELAGSDLLVRAGAEGRERWTISEAGSAHLRRSRAADRDTAFGTQHRDLVVERIETEAGPGTISRNAAESPLAWLRRRKDRDGEPMIDSAAFEAGERLRRDLTLGGVLPSVTARWDGTVGGGSGALRDPAAAADATIAARQRARRALDAVGSDLANLLVDLCGFLKGIETIEREQRWPPRSAKVVIRLALRRLAEHYGLETEARGPDRSRGIRLWREAEAGANSSATLSPPPAEPLPGCG